MLFQANHWRILLEDDWDCIDNFIDLLHNIFHAPSQLASIESSLELVIKTLINRKTLSGNILGFD